MKIKFCPIGNFNDPLEKTLQSFFIDEDAKIKNLEKKRLLYMLKKTYQNTTIKASEHFVLHKINL